jgi:hypothetical protein
MMQFIEAITLTLEPNVMSRVFMVFNKPRDGAMEFAETTPYRYNETYPLGWRNTKDSWDDWPIGKRVGIIFGAVFGVVIILCLIWCCCKRTKWADVREKKKPILLSELRAQQSREERASTGPVEVSERHDAEMQNASGVGRDEEEACLEEPLPTYHAAVNDQERMLAHYAMQRDSAAATVPPPSYPQPATIGNSSIPASDNDHAHQVPNISSTSPALAPYYPPPASTSFPAPIPYHPPPASLTSYPQPPTR